MRRDLHDGLGPALTGVSLGLRTAVRQLDRSDRRRRRPRRRAAARPVADEVDSVVVEVKRIVRDLRPTALDQLGLVDAVAEFTRTFGDELEIHLALPTAPVELPAAVEVATYRIVTEAVTNVVRHAGRGSCWLTISAGTARRHRRRRRRRRHRRARRCPASADGDARTGGGAGRLASAVAERAARAPGSTCACRRCCRDRHRIGAAAGRHRRRPPDVPDRPGGGDRRDGRHRAGGRGPARRPGRGRWSRAAAPDVVLLDVRLGDGSGLEVNRWLAEHHPDVKVIMLTMSEDHDTALTALRDGARGYLVKGAGPERVEHAVRVGRRRRRRARPALAAAVTELAQVRAGAHHRPSRSSPQREFDILELVAEGLDNHAIARRLVLSPKTVRNHVSNVFAKIQAADRPEAIVLARRVGLGTRATG